MIKILTVGNIKEKYLKLIKLMIRKMRKKSLIKKESLRNIFIKDIIYRRKKIKIKVLKI